MVKRFSMPKSVIAEKKDRTLLERIFLKDEAGRVAQAAANQARAMAEVIRREEMQQTAAADAIKLGIPPQPLESFILHDQSESIVTVGRFDGPNDPALADMWRILNNMQYQLYDKEGKPMGQKVRMFDVIVPMPVPRIRK